jgi:hypothetical protein
MGWLEAVSYYQANNPKIRSAWLKTHLRPGQHQDGFHRMRELGDQRTAGAHEPFPRTGLAVLETAAEF